MISEIRQDAIRANGLEFAYLHCGEGPLVLLLHGFPDNAWTWKWQIPRIADAGYRVVAPFSRGYHPSSIPEDGRYDVRTLGDDLIALVTALGEGQSAHVVGHDFGAMMVYAAAAESPATFATATICAVPHPATFALLMLTPELVHHSFHLWFLGHAGPVAAGATAHDDMALIDYIWRYWSPETTDNAEHVRRLKSETFAAPGSLEAAVAYYPALIGSPGQLGIYEELVQPVRVPTLAVYGADDPIPPVLAASEAGFFAAGYRRENVPGSKHFVHRDRPDHVTSLLLEWFSGRGRGAEAGPAETPTG